MRARDIEVMKLHISPTDFGGDYEAWKRWFDGLPEEKQKRQIDLMKADIRLCEMMASHYDRKASEVGSLLWAILAACGISLAFWLMGAQIN